MIAACIILTVAAVWALLTLATFVAFLVAPFSGLTSTLCDIWMVATVIAAVVVWGVTTFFVFFPPEFKW